MSNAQAITNQIKMNIGCYQDQILTAKSITHCDAVPKLTVWKSEKLRQATIKQMIKEGQLFAIGQDHCKNNVYIPSEAFADHCHNYWANEQKVFEFFMSKAS